ncbi:hypothetical protein GCM10023096_18210 [Nonomuraea ferruginea]
MAQGGAGPGGAGRGRCRTRRGNQAVHGEFDGAYGSPRVTAELRAQGRRVNHKRVARVMRCFGIVGLHLRKKVRTTVPEPSHHKVPDLIGRDFTAPAANLRYVGDITSWESHRVDRAGCRSSCRRVTTQTSRTSGRGLHVDGGPVGCWVCSQLVRCRAMSAIHEGAAQALCSNVRHIAERGA